MQPQIALEKRPIKPPERPDRRPILSYLVLSRVPLITLALLYAFFPLSQSKALGAYLAGMYDVTWKAALLVGAAAFLLVLAINVSANTIARTAELRFEIKPLHPWLRQEVRIFRSSAVRDAYPIWRVNLLGAIASLAGVLYFFYGLKAFSVDGWAAYFAALGMFIAMFGVGYLVARVVSRFKGGHGWYTYLVRWWTPDGYVDDEGKPVAGHLFSANAFLLSVALYFAGTLFRPGHAVAAMDLAALVSLLLVMTNVCWLLSGLSYLLDRWRIPMLLVILVAALVTGGNDHVFPVTSCAGCQPGRTAAEILDVAGNPKQPRILVATSGGGILAASWTAKVLGELTATNPGFRNGLRLISSVSGGSVGSMHYVHALRQHPQSFDAKAVFDRAAASSLDSVAYGLAYYDSWRVLGLNRDDQLDRASELRKAWTRHDSNLEGAMLSQWAAGPGVPAMMINSTVAETGERFAFTNFSSGPSRGPAPRRVFWEYYKGQDIEVSAAVANSAAFPYVSPAGRASAGPPIHLLDGGYYDNFGVASALDFLFNGYPDKSKLREQPVLVILIEASSADEFRSIDGVGKTEGWGYQLLAPPKGLLNMWQVAARQRNYEGLNWLREFNVSYVPFTYRGKDSPTSWHLTADNIRQIEGQWAENTSSAGKVADYLKPYSQ
jgi:hypothetical protein